LPANGSAAADSWASGTPPNPRAVVRARAPVTDGEQIIGYAELSIAIPLDVAAEVAAIEGYNRQWTQLRDWQREFKLLYSMLMALITLFVLFVATWVAFFLAKQISVPITALLDASREVRRGNLKHRVNVRAVDELGSLVRAFNQMTE